MISMRIPAALLATFLSAAAVPGVSQQGRPHLAVRAIYGGVPTEILDAGRSLSDYGINAVFLGSGSITDERIRLLRSNGAGVYAEFNTMHEASYLDRRPDAAPVGSDGLRAPAPEGWQGLCPTHAGYRAERMERFRQLLRRYAIDGVWLDYHHAHANWERAEPLLPDTCFCDRCLRKFREDTGVALPGAPVPELARLLLTRHRDAWVRWRCGVFTDWVREFRRIIDGTRPGVLLGTFHNPWSDADFDGARMDKLSIDLVAQARYIDVFSPMPYHARFGHVRDPGWISRQVAWLGQYLGVEGKAGERLKIWPIVQLSDWGESVPASQVAEVLDQGSRLPATGTLVFAWGSLRKQPDKIEEMGRFFRAR
jgi:hypothetical protein